MRFTVLICIACALLMLRFESTESQLVLGMNGLKIPPINLVTVYRILRRSWKMLMDSTKKIEGKEDNNSSLSNDHIGTKNLQREIEESKKKEAVYKAEIKDVSNQEVISKLSTIFKPHIVSNHESVTNQNTIFKSENTSNPGSVLNQETIIKPENISNQGSVPNQQTLINPENISAKGSVPNQKILTKPKNTSNQGSVPKQQTLIKLENISNPDPVPNQETLTKPENTSNQGSVPKQQTLIKLENTSNQGTVSSQEIISTQYSINNEPEIDTSNKTIENNSERFENYSNELHSLSENCSTCSSTSSAIGQGTSASKTLPKSEDLNDSNFDGFLEVNDKKYDHVAFKNTPNVLPELHHEEFDRKELDHKELHHKQLYLKSPKEKDGTTMNKIENILIHSEIPEDDSVPPETRENVIDENLLTKETKTFSLLPNPLNSLGWVASYIALNGVLLGLYIFLAVPYFLTGQTVKRIVTSDEIYDEYNGMDGEDMDMNMDMPSMEGFEDDGQKNSVEHSSYTSYGAKDNSLSANGNGNSTEEMSEQPNMKDPQNEKYLGYTSYGDNDMFMNYLMDANEFDNEGQASEQDGEWLSSTRDETEEQATQCVENALCLRPLYGKRALDTTSTVVKFMNWMFGKNVFGKRFSRNERRLYEAIEYGVEGNCKMYVCRR